MLQSALDDVKRMNKRQVSLSGLKSDRNRAFPSLETICRLRFLPALGVFAHCFSLFCSSSTRCWALVWSFRRRWWSGRASWWSPAAKAPSLLCSGQEKLLCLSQLANMHVYNMNFNFDNQEVLKNKSISIFSLSFLCKCSIDAIMLAILLEVLTSKD